jgi:DNA mismatch repair protein MutS
MSEFADKQTLDDLNLLGRYRNNSIFHIFDHAVSEGGGKLLEQMFQHPLQSHQDISKRATVLKYFTTHQIVFPFTGEEADTMESYLCSGGGKNLVATGTDFLSKKALQVIARDEGLEDLVSQLTTTVMLLNRFAEFINSLEEQGNPLESELISVKKILGQPGLKWVYHISGTKELSLIKLIRYDHKLKYSYNTEIKTVVAFMIQLDVFIAVGAVAAKRGFSYAQAFPKENNHLLVDGLFHPAVENAVSNSLALNQQQNVVFLTGANMAGKSTLMKSFGVALYLAHMGFPIAARKMEFSVKDTLYSSVNVPDNIGLGYSHFYAEVLRVKKIAEAVAADKDLFVIFDELFKGTNVKDAYDATLAITEAFSENRNCFFVISSHITEVGETLQERCGNFRFAYLPTMMDGAIPRYTYRLTDGITKDRHGMMIIKNEGILGLLREGMTSKTNL